MIIESICVHFTSKKLVHYRSTGVEEVETKSNQNLEFSEVISYLNTYMKENDLTLVQSRFVPPDGVIYDLAKK